MIETPTVEHLEKINAEFRRLDAEIERLRAALKEIDDLGSSWPIEDAYYKACGIAQEALQTKDTQS